MKHILSNKIEFYKSAMTDWLKEATQTQWKKIKK